MAALIYDSTSQAFKEAGGAKIYSSSDGAFVDAGGKVWNGSEWVDALGGGAVLTVGSIYTLQGTKISSNEPIQAKCVEYYAQDKYAIMQSCQSFGTSSWPGSGTFSPSAFGVTVGNFSITDMQLPQGTSASNLTACGVAGRSSIILDGLKMAALSGTCYLGTHGSGNGAYCVNSSGSIWSNDDEWGEYGGTNYRNCIAPAFILSLSNVKLKDNILYAK